MADWNSTQYLKFQKERTQPSIDLASRLNLENPVKIADIGCGPGNSTRVVKSFYPGARVIGFDNSENMLAKARQENPELEFRFCDVSADLSKQEKDFDAVFSNACLQWVPDHPKRIEELFGMLKAGGTLAVQIPMNFGEPVHRIIGELAESARWRGSMQNVRTFYTLKPEAYYNLLTEYASSFEIWQTTYYHVLPSSQAVLEWYRSTGLRPYLDRLTEEQRPEFEAEFLESVRREYPPQTDGKVIFKFPRFFFTAVK